MKILKLAACAALAAVSATTFAAKPRSIAFDAAHEAADGATYSTYMVKCSDGSEKQLTAWNESKKWCVGDANSDLCVNKQIKAAQKACKVG